jgi:hypothetical protein
MNQEKSLKEIEQDLEDIFARNLSWVFTNEEAMRVKYLEEIK